MSYIPEIGERVEIFDNGWCTTHITPRWAYRYKGEVVRLNDLSITVRLDDFEGMKIRVDYDDVKPEWMSDIEARKKIKEVSGWTEARPEKLSGKPDFQRE
jgi:hypothetical protein